MAVGTGTSARDKTPASSPGGSSVTPATSPKAPRSANIKALVNAGGYTHAGDAADQQAGMQSLQDQTVTEPGSKGGTTPAANLNVHNPGSGGPRPGASATSPDRVRRTALLPGGSK